MDTTEKLKLKIYVDTLYLLLSIEKSSLSIQVNIDGDNFIISTYRKSTQTNLLNYQEIFELCTSQANSGLVLNPNIKTYIFRAYTEESQEGQQLEFEKILSVINRKALSTDEKLALEVNQNKQKQAQKQSLIKLLQLPVFLTGLTFVVSIIFWGVNIAFANSFVVLVSYVTAFVWLNGWFGAMKCNSCGYTWKSRKNTPPTQCPSCRSKNIQIRKGNY
jgi:rubrerythrin